MNHFTFPCTHSISNNAICGLYPEKNQYGFLTGKFLGTYTAEGIITISEMLKANHSLQSIEYAALVPQSPQLSTPLDA